MSVSLSELYKRFFKLGTLLLGGGYVILPLLQCEISSHYEEISDEDICEYYALSQSLPGLIAINTAVFVGYKLARLKGAIIAITGIVTPAFLAIVLIANLIGQILHLPLIMSVFAGVGIGVLALIFQAIREMWTKTIKDSFSFLVFLLAFLALTVFKISPIYIVIIGIVFGILIGFINAKRGVK